MLQNFGSYDKIDGFLLPMQLGEVDPASVESRVAETLHGGGVEIDTRDLVSGLDESAFEVTISGSDGEDARRP